MWNLWRATDRCRAAPRRSVPSESLRILHLCLTSPQGQEPPDDVREVLKRGIDWVGLAAVANACLVAPALWLALERKGLLAVVPDDFRDYLAAIHRANAARLAAMRRQAQRVLAAVNAQGTVPILLKGGARLFEAGSEDAGGRMMADLDMLVEEPHLGEALAALSRLGYVVVEEAHDRRRHAVALRHPDEPAAIDLHRDAGPQRDFIPLADVIADAAPGAADGCRYRIPSPTHRVMHLFFHSQIHDRGHVKGIIPLRHLEDFAWIAARHAQAIDWPAIRRACDRAGLHRAWDSWLDLAARCLGVAPPTPVRQPRLAWLHYRRCLLQMDHRWLEAFLGAATAATEPLAYASIDYKYGCGPGRAALFRARAVETLGLLAKYRHRLPQRLLAAIREAGDRES